MGLEIMYVLYIYEVGVYVLAIISFADFNYNLHKWTELAGIQQFPPDVRCFATGIVSEQFVSVFFQTNWLVRVSRSHPNNVTDVKLSSTLLKNVRAYVDRYAFL